VEVPTLGVGPGEIGRKLEALLYLLIRRGEISLLAGQPRQQVMGRARSLRALRRGCLPNRYFPQLDEVISAVETEFAN
jgi:hypothetical protein